MLNRRLTKWMSMMTCNGAYRNIKGMCDTKTVNDNRCCVNNMYGKRNIGVCLK